MYVANFEAAEGTWVQAAARIDAAPRRSVAHWDYAARQLAAVLRLPGSTVARRVSIDRERNLHQLIGLTGPRSFELQLRETLARLTRIERLTGAAIELPQSRAERDAWFEAPGRARFCTAGEVYSAQGVPLACDFRIFPSLDQLLTDACIAGLAVTYQVHVRATQIGEDELRSARKCALALRDIPGSMESLVAWQERLARHLSHASAICEEYLMANTKEAIEWLEVWLADRFNAQYRSFGFSSTPQVRADAYEDALTGGLHSFDLQPWSSADLCAGALSAQERDDLLAWQPSDTLRNLLKSGECAEDDNALPQAPPPIEPYHGEKPFVFASYKRQDLPLVAPIIRKVRAFDIPVWYDVEIPGGTEWDEVIEDRLIRSAFVLAFASNAAVQSKYVRREIKFADAIDRPVLGILLEDVKLGHGLAMMMSQYQMLDARRSEFDMRLRQAVEALFGRRGVDAGR